MALTLTAACIFMECVSSGANAPVRAWQVDTLPLTAYLLALINICVWAQIGCLRHDINWRAVLIISLEEAIG